MAKVTAIDRQIEQAFSDWMGGRVFWSQRWPTSRGYFRMRSGERAPWRQTVKRWYGNDVEEFSEAARSWHQANTPPVPTLRVVRSLGEGLFVAVKATENGQVVS